MEDTLGENTRGTAKGTARTLLALIQEPREIMDEDNDECAPFSFRKLHPLAKRSNKPKQSDVAVRHIVHH
eukprot:scaffold60318_cov52-Attheya_sp.AAC.1